MLDGDKKRFIVKSKDGTCHFRRPLLEEGANKSNSNCCIFYRETFGDFILPSIEVRDLALDILPGQTGGLGTRLE